MIRLNYHGSETKQGRDHYVLASWPDHTQLSLAAWIITTMFERVLIGLHVLS